MSEYQHATTVTAPGGPFRAVGAAIGLTLFGILFAELFTMPAIVIEPNLLESPADTSVSVRTVFFALNFIGMAVAGAIYLSYTNRGWAFVDLRMPTRRDAVITLVGCAIILAFYLASSVAIYLLDLPAADTGVLEFIGDDETMVLVMIAIAFLFNSPAEEFLFRNVIQKRLYASFAPVGAVVVASAIFALVHLPVYAVFADSALAIAVPITMLFVGGLILGYLYLRTANLVVPIVVHAVYNSFIWGLLYLSIVYEWDDATTTVDFVAPVLGLLG